MDIKGYCPPPEDFIQMSFLRTGFRSAFLLRDAKGRYFQNVC